MPVVLPSNKREKLKNVNQGGVKWDWWISAANIILNLLILTIYKYFNFFADSFASLCEAFGFHPGHVTLHLVLPVGISFYTFQALSYTIDVYRRKLEPTHDVVAFFAFISFFPQLVAGPIERATNLLPQFQRPRKFDYALAVDGMRQILWGLCKKMILADNCASAVNLVWSDYHDCSGMQLVVGAILFTFQIYGDFSGYSDIAIGSAKLFGIKLMRNFNYPYFSRNIAEFWRRWHISLTTWFRDYIYIPLGGSRCSTSKMMRNTLVIFTVSGFWHGANWTFIVWGIYHAILFFPLFLMRKNRKYTDIVAAGHKLPSLHEFGQMLVTFFLAVIGWIIFRASTMQDAVQYVVCMFTKFQFEMFPYGKPGMVYCLLFLVIEWLQREKEFPLQLSHTGILRFKPARWALYAVMVYAAALLGGTQQEFIYFQF
jgi:D-alanyl-lipoteichoic acid acyltransferase DltB (MBOAT superfamily)